MEPESWAFPDVIEHARKISPNNSEGKPFNQFGLVYSSEEVASLKLSILSATELQKYADIVTHAYPDAVAKQLPEQCHNLPVEQLNETAVAGIAYISINATNSTTRKWATECLSAIQCNFAKIGR
ncbi:hypothetical protein [Shewanella sedimentimangrovi]|uniref:RES domain-containing protein n=1 Tax=Shewanella sedimentimangrovi TaxID=2814293 RepID=A0ABX7R2Y5_9GAMM|nr:hypothetical protein [Shewanella sedimentimangrovi]QSX38192.1 hypothetical protein JYB85_05030 [Shewanella sedimentimangrovi]